MASVVADLETGLQAMLSLKPPGVTGSKITTLTALCNDNVQSESVLVQKLYTHFRKAPGTHKLGVLYVVDSVTRKWAEQAKNAGQPINGSAQDGTYAAGVHRVKELLPALMNDLISNAPTDQKEKIKKMIDIWEKGQTFPLTMLSSFREKLNSQNVSTTPPGSPPPHIQNGFQGLRTTSAQQPTPQAAAPIPNTHSILAALANMARQNNVASPAPAPAPTPVPAPLPSYTMPPNQSNLPPPSTPNQGLPFPPSLPVNIPVPPVINPSQANGIPNYASLAAAPVAAPTPSPVPPLDGLTPAMQQQLILAKALADQGLSADNIASVLNMMGGQGLAGLSAANLPPPPPMPVQAPQNSWSNGDSRDRHLDGMRSPQGHNRRRSRSPSPRGWNARDRRDDYRRDDDRNPYDDRRGYRDRSPARRQSTPPRGGEKWIGYDDSIGKGNIKVLSRTLFVGGVNTGEAEIRRMFSPHGRVQTCIINEYKRHAFVKMASRADAVAAREVMERDPPDSQLRTKWGVGFGPRECSDYTTGVSTIPITSLTDADRKWLLSAEFGGTGGKPIEEFMVVEEPDIEIGQGVSSKAISRRNEKATKAQRYRDRDDDNPNPKTWQRRDEGKRAGSGGRRNDDYEERNDRFANVSAPPAMPPVPSFGGAAGFTMPTLPNGMPMFPFMFPGAQQPPPPGR